MAQMPPPTAPATPTPTAGSAFYGILGVAAPSRPTSSMSQNIDAANVVKLIQEVNTLRKRMDGSGMRDTDPMFHN
jgi:hypothetical protein